MGEKPASKIREEIEKVSEQAMEVLEKSNAVDFGFVCAMRNDSFYISHNMDDSELIEIVLSIFDHSLEIRNTALAYLVTSKQTVDKKKIN
jgi:hypothetical protein